MMCEIQARCLTVLHIESIGSIMLSEDILSLHIVSSLVNLEFTGDNLQHPLQI